MSTKIGAIQTAIIAITGGGRSTGAANQLWGWTFSLSRAIDVTALGALGTEGWNGFQDPHDVGIFRMSDQTLVVSASLPWPWNSGIGFFENGFRYISLTDPVTLSPGDYEILMTMPAGTIDSQYYSASDVTTAQGITWLHSVFNDGDRLRYLTEIVGAYEKGMFGRACPEFCV